MNKPTKEAKFRTVIEKNTFYFYDENFEENYEEYLNSLKKILLTLKHKIEAGGLERKFFEDVLTEEENGLRALLALTGLSNETLKRLITVIRIKNDDELNKLVYKDKWPKDADADNLKEWGDSEIDRLIKSNEYFKKGLVNIFFEGSTSPFLIKTVPLFELKKLSASKLKFEIPEMLDTLVRYKEKGSYSGRKQNNPEMLLANLLDNMNITFEKGDLHELVKDFSDSKRTMDFIIPNKKDPLIIIESSFLATTSSGQGDKSKTEISIDGLLKQRYPKSKFIGFVDGVGWYVRKGDLNRMVSAYEDVFTLHPDELERFKQLLVETFPKKQTQC